ncbi:MAG: hypothetical protein AAFS10_14405, partial [Myxococcota bacterium]
MMDEFQECVCNHMSLLAYKPPAMELERFWSAIAELGWGGERSVEETKAFALERFDLVEAAMLIQRCQQLHDAWWNALVTHHGQEVTETCDENLVWEVSWHVIGLGREVFEGDINDPARMLRRLQQEDYTPGLDDVLYLLDWLPSATETVVDQALRMGTPVRSLNDPDGLGRYELVEHPDYGLGFISLDSGSTWALLTFRDMELTTQRHSAPTRQVTLYRVREDGVLEYRYVSYGGQSDHTDGFVSGGEVGAFVRQMRVYPPRPRGAMEGWFTEQVDALRQGGFEELELPTREVVVQLSGCGLRNETLLTQLRQRTSRHAREGGLGTYKYLRMARERAHLVFDVVGPVQRAACELVARLHHHMPELESFCVASLDSGEPEVWLQSSQANDTSFGLEWVPTTDV